MNKFLLPIFLIVVAGLGIAIKANESYFESEAEVAEEKKPKSYDKFRPEAPGPKAAVLKKGPDNHFWADAMVNKARVRFMVDTGATSVALTREDALRLGYGNEDLDFQYKVNTAGGETRGAFILLDEIKIGNVSVEKVEALVIESELKQSLLGMSFLGELHSYEVRKSSMIIRE
ncbi:TIGR02281 family clan AA aspartic protease [Ponticaulis profundi]|uniref:TIGR02281 family clan AA aspartic protease n=1 Tax=Ponticaulis profundi TaxID=2665222 RepID=A0ABW1S6L3_9PROT